MVANHPLLEHHRVVGRQGPRSTSAGRGIGRWRWPPPTSKSVVAAEHDLDYHSLEDDRPEFGRIDQRVGSVITGLDRAVRSPDGHGGVQDEGLGGDGVRCDAASGPRVW